MAHKFDHTRTDPYEACIPQLEADMFSGQRDAEAGAQEQLYGPLSNAVVTALGDIAATARRLGVADEGQLRGLARAVADMAEPVLTAYVDEVDPEPAIAAVEHDPRFESLSPVDQDKLRREIGKTRQLESLILNSMRLPDLVDLAASYGLHSEGDALESGADLIEQPSGQVTG